MQPGRRAPPFADEHRGVRRLSFVNIHEISADDIGNDRSLPV